MTIQARFSGLFVKNVSTALGTATRQTLARTAQSINAINVVLTHKALKPAYPAKITIWFIILITIPANIVVKAFLTVNNALPI